MPDDLPDLVRDNSREMEQKVEMVLNEIIESEKKYVKTLNTIVEVGTQLSKKILSRQLFFGQVQTEL